MNTDWIFLQSIPPGGTTISLEDHPLWARLMAEYLTGCRMVDPLRATVTILPQETGVLFTGTFAARIILPCNRCAEESTYTIQEQFSSFELFPPQTEEEDAEAESDPLDIDEAVIRLSAHGKGVEISPAGLVWEEFSLALPAKPLCSESCMGLCPSCGCNKNTDTCSCATGTGDSRLAALRGVKITRN